MPQLCSSQYSSPSPPPPPLPPSPSEVTESLSSLPPSKKEKAHLVERRELTVEFLFCLVLVEVMPRLSVHPVPESFIHKIEDLAFKHFKQQESLKDQRYIYLSEEPQILCSLCPQDLP